jgi:hypothetical protein
MRVYDFTFTPEQVDSITMWTRERKQFTSSELVAELTRRGVPNKKWQASRLANRLLQRWRNTGTIEQTRRSEWRVGL